MIGTRLRIRQTSTSALATYAATGYAPTAVDRVMFAAFVEIHASATPDQPTASGTNGLSNAWNLVTTVTVGVYRITIFWSTSSSTTSGVLSFACNGQTQAGGQWHIWEMPRALGSAPVVQSKVASGAGVTVLTFGGDPLAAFSSAFNATMVAHFVGASFPAVRQDDAQGTLLQQGESISTSTQGSIMTYFGPGEVNNPSLEGSSGTHLAIAMEIAIDPAVLPAGSGAASLLGGALVR